MDPTVIVGGIGLVGIIVTSVYAPRLDARRRQRAEEREQASAGRRDDLTAIREEQRDLRLALNEQISDLRHEGEKKDLRIGLLEEQVRGLTTQLDLFRAGIAHPPGFVLLPKNVWDGLRASLGAQLPPGPFVGENSVPPRFGGVGVRMVPEENPE